MLEAWEWGTQTLEAGGQEGQHSRHPHPHPQIRINLFSQPIPSASAFWELRSKAFSLNWRDPSISVPSPGSKGNRGRVRRGPGRALAPGWESNTAVPSLQAHTPVRTGTQLECQADLPTSPIPTLNHDGAAQQLRTPDTSGSDREVDRRGKGAQSL